MCTSRQSERTPQRAAYWLRVADSEQATRVDSIMISKGLQDANLKAVNHCQAVKRRVRSPCSAVGTGKQRTKVSGPKETMASSEMARSSTTTTKLQARRSLRMSYSAKRVSIPLRMVPCTVVNGWEDSDMDMESRLGQMVQNTKENG